MTTTRLPLRSGGWAELLVVVAVAWLLLVSIPLGLGGIGLSWDALNHHIYLGWVAGSTRFDQDFLAAGFQSYQYPYLYWPAYKLFQAGVTGAVAGVVLVTVHLVTVTALWLIARVCIPDRSAYGAAMRAMAVLLAFLGQVVLSLMDTTANDVFGAAPFVWSVALALLGANPPHVLRGMAPRTFWLLSGACAGISVAFKLSNGPLALMLPLLWLSGAPSGGERVKNLAWATLGATIGFALAYGYWGWQLWEHFGNPVYPFGDTLFEPLRRLVGWQP